MTLLLLCAAAAGVIACATVAAGETSIDRALPFLAVVVALLSFATRRFDSIVFLAVPLLVVVSIAVGDDRIRLFCYGVILLFAAIVSLTGMVDGGAIESWRAVALVLSLVAALRAIPLTLDRLVPLMVLLVGVAALMLVLANASMPLHIIPIIVGVGLVTPLIPLRAAAFPLLLATLIVAVRTRAVIWIGVAFVFAVIAGRWALLLAAIAIVPALTQRWITSRRGSHFVAAPLNATAVPLARTLVFAPSFAFDLAAAALAQRIAAVILSVVALLVRPALAMLYLIAALVLVVTTTRTPLRTALAIPPTLFVSLWVVLFAWSGALIPFFPLPLWLDRGEERHRQLIGMALAPGESVVIHPDRRSAGLTLIASGSNVSGLSAGTPVGRLDFVDQSGRGYRRNLAIGEVSDWGAFRQEQFFRARNPVPTIAAEPVEGFGATAFVPALSRIRIGQVPVTSLRVTAASALPPAARLELHRLEFPR